MEKLWQDSTASIFLSAAILPCVAARPYLMQSTRACCVRHCVDRILRFYHETLCQHDTCSAGRSGRPDEADQRAGGAWQPRLLRCAAPRPHGRPRAQPRLLLRRRGARQITRMSCGTWRTTLWSTLAVQTFMQGWRITAVLMTDRAALLVGVQSLAASTTWSIRDHVLAASDITTDGKGCQRRRCVG